jgi:uncharacterized RDD family membrane protein YckC
LIEYRNSNNPRETPSPSSPPAFPVKRAPISRSRAVFNWIVLMNTDATTVAATTQSPRAGFWRRFLSLLIDVIIVTLPFQAVAAVLFAATAGYIQMQSGFFSECQNGKDIPQALSPPPPRDSNFMRVCRTSFFGATSGATLTVGRTTKEGTTTTTVSQIYMLDKDGTVINGHSIDGIVQLGLLAYLVAMIRSTGKTLGARVVRVKVIDTANPGVAGVPLRKAILRYLAMFIGDVPAFALLLYGLAVSGGSADAMFTAGFFKLLIVALLLGGIWSIVLIVQIARKTDPYYDRLAGTAVVRV